MRPPERSKGVSHVTSTGAWPTQPYRFYRCLLTELRKQGLEAMVILYYPTNRAPLLGLPGPVHGSRGWLNRSTVEAFQSYPLLQGWALGELLDPHQ
ncbi:beta-klotho-like [Oncorhynchus keta]|uniref:beta-klotho-like n=1 Tax=Oncorhynchus keta TaxID=8018 RepID=UPI00227C827A|nr:beta-klotho-like [Oncorhynchus keta]